MSVFLYGLANTNSIDDRLISAPLDINNAGYTKIDTANISTYRPKGRNDYQLIFVKSGVCYLKESHGETPVLKEHIIIFRPNEVQDYKFYKQDRTEIFWIHFGGTWVKELFCKLNIDSLKIFEFPHGEIFINTANYIMNALRKNEPYCNLSCTAKLLELFYAIGNRDTEFTLPHGNSNIIDKISLDIANNYYLDISNEEYARKYNMSVSHFIKLFKATTGTTPQQFKALQRIGNAENLLCNTDLKITEISHILGFSDSLYFSKFFSKIKGISPSAFRAEYKKEQLSNPPPTEITHL